MDKCEIITRTQEMLEAFFAKKPTARQELVCVAKNLLNAVMKISEADFDYDTILNEVISRYETNVGIKTFEPDVLVEDPNSNRWFTLQDDNSRTYFKRYRDYLRQQGWGNDMLDNLESNCEKTLSRCADPKDKATVDSKKRGLVMGDVQAGKTANYLGLINMACDYGYRVIVLIAGLTDSLRTQTQERIDYGFIGAYSNSIGNGMPEYVGVGDEDGKYYAVPLTNSDFDFNKMKQQNMNFQATDTNKPVILVVKKNAAILSAVHNWLNPGEGISGDSVLIIDDEADNASPNTKKPGYDASAINRKIRDIYNKFPIASYVGFTATPFANIFINPFDDDEYQDLFPQDFIVQLNAPSTYFGSDKVFPCDGSDSPSIRLLDTDEHNFIPLKHKKDYVVYELAESLKEAILAFLINNVVRTLRGGKHKHRSMMINSTALNAPQESVSEAVNSYLKILLNIIEQDSLKPESDFVKNDEMRKLYDLYVSGDGNGKDFYREIRNDLAWVDIQHGLYDEIRLFETTIINNRYRGKLRYDYSAHKDVGSRVIVIGGFVLSRGLTLEGLCVSYYSRSASAYDSLLQMCRWFGYRPRYEDLCRIYLSQNSIDRFQDVLEAIRDMKDQFREMELQGKTPKDFGLMIKESPVTLGRKLLVTSRNKMYNTQVIEHVVNYGGEYFDTSKLFKDNQKNLRNHQLLDDFIVGQQTKGFAFTDENGRFMLRGVSSECISALISKIAIPNARGINQLFDCSNLSAYIAGSELFKTWDVVVAEGRSDRYFNIQGKDLQASKRAFHLGESDENYIRIGGANNRIVDPNMFGSGVSLSPEQKEKILAGKKTRSGKSAKQLTAKDWLKLRKQPILVLHYIDLEIVEENHLKKDRCVAVKEEFGEDLLIGFAIGFPSTANKETHKYRANLVMISNLAQDEEFDEEELDNEE